MNQKNTADAGQVVGELTCSLGLEDVWVRNKWVKVEQWRLERKVKKYRQKYIT